MKTYLYRAGGEGYVAVSPATGPPQGEGDHSHSRTPKKTLFTGASARKMLLYRSGGRLFLSCPQHPSQQMKNLDGQDWRS